MSTRPRIIPVDGRNFDGGVLRANETSSTAPATVERKLADERLTSVAEGLGALRGEDRSRASAWILGRMASNKEGDALLCRIADLGKADLITQHEALKEQCRAAKVGLENIQARIGELSRELQKQKEKTFIAATRLDQAKANLAALDPYATRKERDAAQQAVEETAKAWTIEHDAEAYFVQQRNQVSLTEKEAAIKKLNELGAQEMRLRCLISGEAYVDSTYGIQVPERI